VDEAGDAHDETATKVRKEQPQPDDQFVAEGELGDVDLVDAMLERPEAVEWLAVRLIRQQTGWDDLELRDAREEDDAAACVAVEHGDECLGYLRTRHAGAATVKPWAEWLSRWLVLGDSYMKHRQWAYTDDLTGAGNRRFFYRFLGDALERARQNRRPVTVLVFDIDDFKLYNDRYGHDAGDEILRETVRLLTSVIRQGDRVCRIGGDEFVVIFADPAERREVGSDHPETIESIARRFQDQIAQMRFPKLGPEAKGELTVSGGLATFPWDASNARDLLRLADQRAIASKRKGKNVITLGPDTADIGGVS
jgi:diguanylate cyclase (GGDEF)-like protein